jgi:penicillin-binding protein 1A
VNEPTADAAPARRRLHWTRPRIVLAVSLAVVFLLWLLWQRCGLSGCPTVERLSAYQPGGESVLLDAAGEHFADLSPIEYEVVDLDSLPEHIPNAFIAVEDRRFHEHHGVDARRFVGALLANIKARRVAQGFSTITMQLARNVWPDRLPGQQRTLSRKILEVRVAREIERKYDKREILELYLNHIYFGDGAYGIDAAARNTSQPAKR